MKKPDYLHNARIFLRAVEPEDLDVMYDMENNPSLWDVSSFNVPYSRYALKQYIQNSCNDIYSDKQLRLMIVRRSDHAIAGTIDITDYDPMHRRGAVGIAIREEFRNQGIAADALELLIDYAFGFLHFRQLYGLIAVGNEGSLKLFSEHGFVQSGVLRDWICVADEFRDVAVLQLIQGGHLREA